MKRLLITISLVGSIFLACAGASIFQPIGDNLSAPIALVFDTATSRLYVVNSNDNVAFSNTTMIVLDVSDPTAPVILDLNANPVEIPELSGQAFIDASTQRLFIANRFSPDKVNIQDDILVLDVDEGTDFGDLQKIESGENLFGMACCDSSDRFYAVSDGELHVFELADPTQKITVDLSVTLQSGQEFDGNSTTHVTLYGTQAFLSNRAGVIYVINIANIGVDGENPIDYLITNLHDLKSIVNDGTNIYIDEVDFNDTDIGRWRSIDPTTVPPIADNGGAVIEVDIDSEREGKPVEKQRLDIGEEPAEMLVFKDRLYITNSDDNTVSVLDISDPDDVTLEITIDLTDGGFSAAFPFSLAAATFGAQDLLYVGNLGSNTLSIIDIASNTVIADYP